MEHVEEIRLSEPSRAASVVGRPLEVAESPMPKWMLPSIAVHAMLLFGVVLAAYAFGSRIDKLTESDRVGQVAVAALSSDTAQLKEDASALRDETTHLKNEVADLRQFIASSSSEDVIFLKITILKPEIDSTLARDIARHIHKYCEQYGRDPNLVLAMVSTESDFNPRARSSVGALGLMQVMPQWKKVLGIEGDLTDIEVSIKVGLQILGFYSEMYRDVEMTLTAYNRGPGPVDFALMKGRDPRNKYAPRVLGTYNKLKRLTVRTAGA